MTSEAYQKIAIYVSRELHLRVKLRATTERTTVSELGEQLIHRQLDSDQPKTPVEIDDDRTG